MNQPATDRADPGQRPRPSITADNKYFWDGAAGHELRIQTCSRCATKYFPPTPRCWSCGSYEMGFTVASGRGELYSWAIAHHPQAPGFDYPLTIGLVALEEGTRLVADIVDCPREQLQVGLPLEVRWLDCNSGDGDGDRWSLPQFAPRTAAAGTGRP